MKASGSEFVAQAALLRPDPDENLARYLNAVRPLELAELLLNFHPSPFTLGFA